MATPKKKKARKTPETHPIYDKMDHIVEQQKNATKFDPKKQRAVMGLSFSDYAEYKVMGGDAVHDPWIQRGYGVNVAKNYLPHMTQEPVNVNRQENGLLTIKPFTAAEKAEFGLKTDKPETNIFTGAATRDPDRIIWPKYYQNPYQFQDYVFLQDIYANTIAGRIIETVGFFALARGIKPKLKIKNEDEYKDDDAKQKILDEHKWMTDTIEELERNISTSSTPKAFGDTKPGVMEYPVGPMGTAKDKDQPTYDTPLQKKWFAALMNELNFGREIIVPRVDRDDNEVEVQEEGEKVTYKNIPKIMLVIHPRDMGFNYVDYRTHRLLGIQLNNSNWILQPDEMIFWEWMPDNPVYGSKFYGMSAAQSMMGAARTLRRIIEVDFPLIAKTRWSGMYWLVFKRKGEQASTSDNELQRILANIELNGINATLEDEPKEDFMLHKIDLDPKIQELLQTVKDLIQYMMSQVGMPQGLLYGEDSLNRDTLKAKISAWTKGSLKRYREPFLDAITDQWYRRLCKTLEAQSKKWKAALDKFEIVADVEEFKLDNREDLINALMMLENITGPWTDEARSNFLEIEGLQAMIDPDKGPEDVPPMPGGKGFNVRDNQSGKEFGVSQSNG